MGFGDSLKLIVLIQLGGGCLNIISCLSSSHKQERVYCDLTVITSNQNQIQCTTCNILNNVMCNVKCNMRNVYDTLLLCKA